MTSEDDLVDYKEQTPIVKKYFDDLHSREAILKVEKLGKWNFQFFPADPLFPLCQFLHFLGWLSLGSWRPESGMDEDNQGSSEPSQPSQKVEELETLEKMNK